MTGWVTSSIAFNVASFGERPCSMWCSTASTTTIASSTTRPIARTRPNSDSVLIEKPSIGKKMNVPTSETGTATRGISVARQPWRKRNTTMMHENDRLEEGVGDLLDALRDRQSRVERDHVVEVVREPLLQLLHRLLDALGGCDRIGARDLEDADRTGRLPVQPRALLVVQRAEVDAADVLQAYHGPVRVQPHDHVAELLRRHETALRPDRVGELLALRRRLGPEAPRRVDGALLLHRVEDVRHRQAEAREAIRLDPDAHGVVGRAVVLDLSDARDAEDRVVDVDRRVVAEEERVVGALRRVEGDDQERITTWTS